jgi:hypothetical protein
VSTIASMNARADASCRLCQVLLFRQPLPLLWLCLLPFLVMHQQPSQVPRSAVTGDAAVVVQKQHPTVQLLQRDEKQANTCMRRRHPGRLVRSQSLVRQETITPKPARESSIANFAVGGSACSCFDCAHQRDAGHESHDAILHHQNCSMPQWKFLNHCPPPRPCPQNCAAG